MLMICKVDRYRWSAFGKLFLRYRKSAKCLCYFMTLRTLEYSCLVGSIALIGTDRIDLLAERAHSGCHPFWFWRRWASSFVSSSLRPNGGLLFSRRRLCGVKCLFWLCWSYFCSFLPFRRSSGWILLA